MGTNKINTHLRYLAGDLADPHGNHIKCLDIVFESHKKLKQNHMYQIAGYGFTEQQGWIGIYMKFKWLFL